MKILFIEDDDNKIKQVNDFLREYSPNLDLVVGKSYNSGLKYIMKETYDVILLDISMPVFDKSSFNSGGYFMKFGGEDILKEMKRNNISAKTIIVTQYDDFGEKNLKELKISFESEFKENYVGTVFYNAAESNWKKELKELLKNVI